MFTYSFQFVHCMLSLLFLLYDISLQFTTSYVHELEERCNDLQLQLQQKQELINTLQQKDTQLTQTAAIDDNEQAQNENVKIQLEASVDRCNELMLQLEEYKQQSKPCESNTL